MRELTDGMLHLTTHGRSDLIDNLSAVLSEGELAPGAKALVCVAVCLALRSPAAAGTFTAAAVAAGRSEGDVDEARSLAVCATTFNTYFRFRAQAEDSQEDALPEARPRFRANALLHTKLPRSEAEAIYIAVSSVNGCGHCVQEHVGRALKAGLSWGQIDEAIRVASVAAAFAVAMSGGAGE